MNANPPTPTSPTPAPAPIRHGPTDRTARGQTESIAFEFELPHAPAKVWRALTDPVLLSEWLLPVIGFKLDANAEFTFKAPAQQGWDGTVNCRMREIEPLKRLSWAWVVGDIDTVVTFSLAPMPGGAGTHLSLVHSGFKPHQKHNFAGAIYGWKMMGTKLVDVIGRIS